MPHLPRRAFATLLAVPLLLAGGARSFAHDLERTQVVLTVAAGGRFVLEIRNDPTWLLLRLESFAGATVPPTLTAQARDARLTALAPTFRDRVVLFAAGREVVADTVEYIAPPLESDRDGRPPLATYRLEGTLPAGARTLRWLYGLVIDPYPLTVRRTDGVSTTEWVHGSDWSGIVEVSAQATRRTRAVVLGEYLALGYTHILPKGLDHILFVLGLFLLNLRLRPILAQVTAFTIAHSLTLALSVYGLVSFPSRVVEPLIALSIAYVAIENLATTKLKPWRLALVFTFGLLHGLGFAGVLADLGLPRDDFAVALVSFNVGVEAGQLTVLGAAAALLLWTRDREWYHRSIVVPASIAIAATGVYWTIVRL